MSYRPSKRTTGGPGGRGGGTTIASGSSLRGATARRGGARSRRASIAGPPSESSSAGGKPQRSQSGPMGSQSTTAVGTGARGNRGGADPAGGARGGESKGEGGASSLAERNRQAALKKRTEQAAANKLKQRRQQITPFQRFKRRYLRCGARGLRDMDVPISEEAVQACESIFLTPKDIARIKSAFDTVDIDGSGEIDRMEMFEYLDEVRSPFSEGVFDLAGEEASKRVLIPFNDFLLIVVRYCMFSKEEILRFTFSIFDVDDSGALDEDEFIQLAHVVNGKNPIFPGNFSRALEEFDTNDDGEIDFDEFRELNRRYPMVLFPAFRLQDAFRRKTLGLKTWNRVIRIQARAGALVKYKRSHDGALPYESRTTKLKRKIMGWVSYDPDPETLIRLHEAAAARVEAARQAEEGEDDAAESKHGDLARPGGKGAGSVVTGGAGGSEGSPTPDGSRRRNRSPSGRGGRR